MMGFQLNKRNKKPTTGFFSFTCCQGCQFTVLFIDEILNLLSSLNVQYFHLIKEKNRNTNFDLAFVEGAITTKKEIKKLKEIRKKSKMLVAIGACACHGGVPAMRNFIENKALKKYVYNQQMLKDSIPAEGLGKFVKVDYYMYGCPIIKNEFVNFIKTFLGGGLLQEPQGNVCGECPRQGTTDCFLRQKKECMGAITRQGCNALCIDEGVPCMLCRGPVDAADFAAEISLFEMFGLEIEDIKNKINRFKNV